MSLFSRASLKRSSRTRTQKDSVSIVTDILCAPPRPSSLVRRKTRPPPLQIIPELSENELDFDVCSIHSPATARPTHFPPQQPQLESRVTLSAYTFSIDDALLMFGDDTPRSPALSVSSSTDGASSEGVPTTPGTSDDEDGIDIVVSIPRLRLRPRPISVRPLCITKTRSSICQGEEDVHSCFENAEETIITLPLTEAPSEVEVAALVVEESEEDFYTREFEDFISLFPVSPSGSSPARRDSLTLAIEALPTVIEVLKSEPRGRSRHSKPLPFLPPTTPPLSTFPSLLPLVQTTAHSSIVRRKRNIHSLPSYPRPPPPTETRPRPHMDIPQDIEDCLFPEEDINIISRMSVISEQGHNTEEDACFYSRPSLIYTPSVGPCPLAPAIPETPLSGMYDEVSLPRSSIDSDAPRSSVDSTSSFASTSSNTPISPFSFPESLSSDADEFDATERLRSRWSSSTLGSLAAEPPRTTLLSPLRNVFGSRMRRVPPQKTPPQTLPQQSTPPKTKHRFAITPSPPSRHIRGGSRSSTSSASTIASDCESHDGSPSRVKRRPIPMAIFLRAS